MTKGSSKLCGSHLTLDCLGCDEEKLKGKEYITDFLEKVIVILGMRKIIDPVVVECKTSINEWDTGGLSAFVIIAESHISIHTFPSAGLLTADIYSCKSFDSKLAISMFEDAFEAKKTKTNLISREIELLRSKELYKLSMKN